MSPAEHQPMRSVGTKRSVRAHPIQSAEPTGDGIRPVTRTRRNGLHCCRPRWPKASGAVRPVAESGVAHTGPKVPGHLGTGIPGRRFATSGLQIVPDNAE